jgi:hypothetical protein
LAKYEAEFKKLPNKGELIDFVTNHHANREDSTDRKVGVVGYLEHLQADDPSLTLDTTMQRFFHMADLRVEKKAWKKGFEILKNDEDIQKARQLVRKVWAASLACGGDHGFRPGAIQETDHIEHLIESFRRDLAGANDARKFRTGFATIDTSTLNIGLDNEHAVCIYGPSNNAKTSLALTLAYNFARNGKNGLIFVGEHQAEKVEKRLAIIHSDNFKDRFIIPGISAWESKEPARRPKLTDFENIQAVLRDLQAMKTVPGYLEVKNINSLGGTPREGERQSRQASGAQGKPDGIAVGKVVKIDVIALEGYLALVGGEGETDRAPDGVFKGFTQEQSVGRAEAIVTVAREPGVAVDVGSAQSWLEVEGDDAAGRSGGLGDQEAQLDGAFAVALDGGALGGAERGGALLLLFPPAGQWAGQRRRPSAPTGTTEGLVLGKKTAKLAPAGQPI